MLIHSSLHLSFSLVCPFLFTSLSLSHFLHFIPRLISFSSFSLGFPLVFPVSLILPLTSLPHSSPISPHFSSLSFVLFPLSISTPFLSSLFSSLISLFCFSYFLSPSCSCFCLLLPNPPRLVAPSPSPCPQTHPASLQPPHWKERRSSAWPCPRPPGATSQPPLTHSPHPHQVFPHLPTSLGFPRPKPRPLSLDSLRPAPSDFCPFPHRGA